METSKFAMGNILKYNDILWDYILGNAVFILMNIQIPLFFIFIKVNHPVLLLLSLWLISLNLIPSYTALKSVYAIHTSERNGILKTYFRKYRRLLKNTMPASVVVTGLLMLFYYDINYYQGTPMVWVFQILLGLTVILVFNFMTLSSRGSLPFQQSIALLRKYSVKLLLVSLLEIGALILGIFAVLYITKLYALVLFPMGIYLSGKFYAPIRESIENKYPDLKENWTEKNSLYKGEES